MKTSRSQKDPILPGELIILLVIAFIAVVSGLLVNPILSVMNWFALHH